MSLLLGDAPVPVDQLREFSKALPRCRDSPQEEDLEREYPSLLDKIIDTAYHSRIDGGHRAVAIHALCSLSGSVVSLGISRPWMREQWFKALYIVLDKSDATKSKPIRQLLEILFRTLSIFGDAESLKIKEDVVSLVVDILLQQSDHVRAKPALHIVTHLLSKDVVSLDTLVVNFGDSERRMGPPEDAPSSRFEHLQSLLLALFRWVRLPDTAIAAGQAACAVVRRDLDNVSNRNGHENPIWAGPLVQVLQDDVEDFAEYRFHLLPELFKLRVSHYMQFLSSLGLEDVFGARNAQHETSSTDELSTRLLFMCLEVGKDAGIVIDSEQSEISLVENIIFIPESSLSRAIENSIDSVRLSGLNMLVSSFSVTRPFTRRTLRYLWSSLPDLVMETDVYVRAEVLVFVQRLVDRMKASIGPLSRSVGKAREGHGSTQVKPQSQKAIASPKLTLRQHRKFLRSFLRLVKNQLHPAAPYQRHITGLRALTILAKSGLDDRLAYSQLSKQAQAKEAAKWPFSEHIFDPSLTRILQDLLLNPFEDVRSFAASLLVLQAGIPESSLGANYSQFLSIAEQTMLSSGRADHADGVARANAIIFETAEHVTIGASGEKLNKERQMETLLEKLERGIALAKDNLPLAVGKYPLHGVLASLRLVLEAPGLYPGLDAAVISSWLAFHSRLVAALQGVWDCVKGVLCNDAPEGFVPDDMEEESGINTKDILSYCWRALKESSSLLRVLASKASITENDRSLLSHNQFESLCKLAFTELVELRHRGAFSAVAQSFAACCVRANALGRDDLLRNLYMNALNAIKEKGSATTRRSAGLPSLIVGVLSACPSSPLFDEAINDLLHEAGLATDAQVVHGDPLPQVHALNCLKAMFTSTILGPHTEPHLPACLTLAGDCLTSSVWAIRNCGLMLFRALINRLLGSTDSQNWFEDRHENVKSRVSYNDYPGLLEIVLRLLSPESTRLTSAQSALESVFPALNLIQRMIPPSESHSEVCDLVLRLCESPHWHVRDMAARTYASLVPSHQRWSNSITLIPSPYMGQNLTHGRLLCISHLIKLDLRSSGEEASSKDELVTKLREAFDHLSSSNECPFTESLFLEILNTLNLDQLRPGQKSLIKLANPSHSDISMVLDTPPATRKARALHVLLQYMLQLYEKTQTKTGPFAPETPDLLEYLQLLEMRDPETYVQILEPIIDLAANIPSTTLSIIADHLCDMAASMHDQNPRIVSHCCLLLVKMHESLGEDKRILHLPLRLEDMRRSIADARDLPPSLLENTLLLWGVIADQACIKKLNKEILDELGLLLNVLQPLIEEQQPFDLRIAVARCFASIVNLWSQDIIGECEPQLHRTQLKFIFLAYDLLNDDDDEIRAIATKIASVILTANRVSFFDTTVPLKASQKLIRHMLTHFNSLPELFDETVARLIDTTRHSSAKMAFSIAATENTALFMVEKQNLFIDPVREAVLWSQALKHLCQQRNAPREPMLRFATWTREALTLLHEKMRSQTAGVLGWSSKPDMFIFGMRVWCAVDVILERRRRFGRKASEGMSKLVVEVGQMLELGREREVHPVWLAKMEKILVRDVRERLRRSQVGRVVRALEARLCEVIC